jgi:predicted nucleic acid-binding Zn finger protein
MMTALEWCSCEDNSTKHLKCKHLFAIEFAIKWGTIKDIDRNPDDTADQDTTNDITPATNPLVGSRRTKSYLEDDYDF